MQRIVVNKKLLEKKIAEMRNGKSGLVEICIVPAQTDGEIFSPAFLHFGCAYPDGTYEDHESIDECAVAGQFVRKSA